MKLSVIIVSYNVRYFLEKCLVSVQKSLQGIDGEVIVIDNHSVDKSVEMVRAQFPGVILIDNQSNTGFARACNQGLHICRGEYALLLNPDTLVTEHTFTRCLEFMDARPEASACGVRMVDGTGTALPESMRGLPTPWSAFCKMTGLAALFPRSGLFNGYYLGDRDRGSIQESPVLTGAFMFMRMQVIREIGMLDEAFFMYGEDIDLSYRMIRAGYKNYYLPEPSIIHYKGESTQRDRLRYVMHFYNAMLIYVRKHLHGIGGGVFRLMIVMGIIVRGGLGALRRIFSAVAPFLADAAVTVVTILLVTHYWATMYFNDPAHFDHSFFWFNLPLYAAIWLLFLFLNGAHDAQRNARRIISGVFLGTVAILVVYAMLPLQYRSSRAVILISAVVISILLVVGTVLYNRLRERIRGPHRVGIVGSREEVSRILEILNRTGENATVAGWIAVGEDVQVKGAIGHVSALKEIVETRKIDELVFSQDLAFSEINTWMSLIGPSVSYRISSAGSGQIVGSDSRREQGTLYTARVAFALAYPVHRRLKRCVDVLVAVLLILVWPLVLLAGRGSHGAWSDICAVLIGKKTWVGYDTRDPGSDQLPSIRPAVVPVKSQPLPAGGSEIHMINYIYAREYTIWKDLDVIFRNFSRLIR